MVFQFSINFFWMPTQNKEVESFQLVRIVGKLVFLTTCANRPCVECVSASGTFRTELSDETWRNLETELFSMQVFAHHDSVLPAPPTSLGGGA